MRVRRFRAGRAISTILVVGAFMAVGATGSAVADGPCGQDYTGPTACGINSASTPNYDGTLVANNEVDYYVFYAYPSTHLSLSITDTEDPGCGPVPGPVYCGQASVDLYDSQGNYVGGSGYSSPTSGITVPANYSTILPTAGTYYLKVSGSEGQDANSNPTQVPYRLSVSATPNVQWPAPPPPPRPPACVVPNLKGKKLPTVRIVLSAAHCQLGKVHHKKAAKRSRNRVISQSPGAGAPRANNYRVGVTLGR